MPEGTAARPRGRNDPDRPDKIARGALEVIARHGVEGLTHRAVATAAGVPLGSTTYHYATLDDILAAALRTAMDGNAQRLADWAEGLGERPDVAAALTERVMSEAVEHEGRTIVEYELYLAALRRSSLQRLSLEWSAVMTDVLTRFVDAETADALSALYDGLLMRVLVSGHRLDRGSVEKVFRRVSSGTTASR